MRRATGMLVLLLCLAWTSAARAAVSVELDDALNVAGFQSYAWKQGKPAQHAWVQNQIVSSVEFALEKRGLSKVDGEADLYVQTYALIDEHTLEELADPTNWEFWTGVTSVDIYQINVGTLVIDLVDGRTQKTVFRGVATETAAKTAEKTQKKINRVILKVFDYLPARGR